MIDSFDFSPPPSVDLTDLPKIGFRDLTIQTKEKTLVRLTPNAVQEKYLDVVAPAWRDDDYSLDGVREMILKARQEGFSTIIAALLFISTYNQKNTNTVVIADDMDNSENLFKKVRTMYENLPPEKIIPTDYAGKRVLSWPALKSSYQVLTAGRRAAGRSRTVNYLHMSERPFWPESDILTGLLQSVPADGAIFDESTANGEGNLFHKDYIAAKKGESTFEARFYAWWENPEYSLTPPVGFCPCAQGDDLAERFGDEAALKIRYHLTDSQIYWRRRKMMEPGQGPMFAQEYPSDDTEAFMVSGARFFEEWDPAVHVCLPFDIPAHWQWFGAYDWGFAAPQCFLLAAISDTGDVVVTDELYAPGLTNAVQASEVESLLKRRGLWTPGEGYNLKPGVAADPSMWYEKKKESGMGYRDIEAFHALGLPFFEAVKNEQGAWSNVRTYLSTIGKLRVFLGRCSNLIRTIPQMRRNPARPERMAEMIEGQPAEDHAPATLSYLLNSRPMPAEKPNEEEKFITARMKRRKISETPPGGWA